MVSRRPSGSANQAHDEQRAVETRLTPAEMLQHTWLGGDKDSAGIVAARPKPSQNPCVSRLGLSGAHS